MGEPKVIRDLRQVVFDSGIVLAETVLVAADQDIDDCTGYATATEPAGAGNITLDAVAARIEHPRNVVITITAGGGFLTGDAIVYGRGLNGRATSESFTLTGGGTYTGNVPFLTVDKANIYNVTGTLTTADTIKIGNGAKISMPMPDGAKLVDIVKERFNGVDIAITAANVNRTYGTYTPTSTLDGAKALELWYTVDIPLLW
jgi:hypothetical protein